MRRLVLRSPNAKVRRDAHAEYAVHFGDASLAVQFDETVPLGKIFELALDHGLVPDKRLKEIVR